jgi:predicted transcriptional regulator
MEARDFSRFPAFEPCVPLGAICDDALLNLALEGRDLDKVVARQAMSDAFPVVNHSAPIDRLTASITQDCPAVFMDMGSGRYEILIMYDLLHAIA